jgi:eukaryotic-like serine/threonine-protein kinase
MIGETLGQFRVLEMIGAGGMGVVYRAHDERLDRDVALKVLPSGTLSDEQIRRRFRQEALALSRLNHPNIATVHDFNSQGAVDFLVMEWIPGETLDTKIAAAPLPEREALRLAIQLVQGLEAAHRQGVIHRDLKPGNLRITPDERLKILDFGLAMLRQAEMADSAQTTELGEHPMVAGSPPYMSPEQLLGEKVDSRSDLYAAGAVLYEMCTGRRPWPQAQGARLIDAILHLLPLPPRDLNARLSPGLEVVILKCLDKDPDRRYQSARELLVDLERLSVPSAITSPQPRPARRTTWMATVSASALLALLMGSRPGGARARVALEPPGPIQSLAVLPLANRSNDPAQEYFADGMTDALIADLGQISALRVISRTSSMQYKGARKPLPQIARELGVDAVVEGSVLRDGNRVRITAQLLHAHTDRQLWTRHYERDLTDVITLQREVAASVATEVRAKLTAQEKTRLATPRPVNAKAYEAYLRGRHFLQAQGTEASAQKAMEAFEEAVREDPGYASAHVGVSQASVYLAGNFRLSPKHAFARAKAAATRAQELDPALPDAHAALAFAQLVLDRDWKASEAGFQRALELSPNAGYAHESYAWFLAARGRLEESLSEMKAARDLDPLSPIVNAGVAAIFMYKRQTGEALAQLQKTLELNPEYQVAHYGMGRVHLADGKPQEAIRSFQRADAGGAGAPHVLADLSQAYALAGRRDEALATLKRWEDLTRSGGGRHEEAARMYAALGDKARALSLLERACQEGSPTVVWLKVDPRYDSLRSEPRFKALLVQLGLSA